MNTQNERLCVDWLPKTGFQLRKAGVRFDAVRVDGAEGRRLADLMDSITTGDPGPIVTESNGCRAVYFYLPAGSTANRVWAPGVRRFNSASGTVSYVPVPALDGKTWPLFWYCPPSDPERFVHPLLLRNAAAALFGHPMSFGEAGEGTSPLRREVGPEGGPRALRIGPCGYVAFRDTRHGGRLGRAFSPVC